jgi:molecular chaperone GrpE
MEWNSIVPPEPDPEIARLESEAKRWLEVAQRSQAELANAQARMRRELDERTKYAVEGFVRELIPALDSLAKAVDSVTKAGGAPAVVDAIVLIDREVLRALAKGGIRPIQTAGAKFDPQFHEAVAMVTAADREDQTIVTEVRRGYLIQDRVLRPAQVVVARRPAGGANGGEGAEAKGRQAPSEGRA